MPRKRRHLKQRTSVTVAELARRAHWGGVLPDIPPLTPQQLADWHDALRALGIEPSGNTRWDVHHYHEATRYRAESAVTH